MAKLPRSTEVEPARGRPRLHDSDADKLMAFRQRLQSAGYLRREVLVTERVAQELARLAVDYGVSAGDAASALLEFGLERFVAEMRVPESQVAQAPRDLTMPMTPASASAAPPMRAAAAAGADPITTFFKRRRGDPG